MRRDDETRKALFAHKNLSSLAKAAGMTKSTIYNRRDKPGKITLDELAGLTIGMDAEQIGEIVERRR